MDDVQNKQHLLRRTSESEITRDGIFDLVESLKTIFSRSSLNKKVIIRAFAKTPIPALQPKFSNIYQISQFQVLLTIKIGGAA